MEQHLALLPALVCHLTVAPVTHSAYPILAALVKIYIPEFSTRSVNLPRDISLNIFSRVPIESVLDSKLVSKAWLNILKDPSFPQKHLLYPRLHDFGFVLYTANSSGRFSLSYLELAAGNQFRHIKKIRHPFINEYYTGSFFRILIGSCNGLICFATNSNGDPTTVSNPITNEYYYLPQLNASQPFVRSGFGYNHSTGEYKVVRIFERGSVNRVQVCTLGGTSDGWVDKYDLNGYKFHNQRGIFANGEIYWLCDYKKIVAFNVADETFREFINFPPSIKAWGEDNEDVIPLFSLKGSLCVMERVRDENRDVCLSEIWFLRKRSDIDVTGKLQDSHSWNWIKEFSIPTMPIKPLAIAESTGGLLFMHDNVNLCFYDQGVKHDLWKNTDGIIMEAIPHTNSFISLKALVGERPTLKSKKLFAMDRLYSPYLVTQLLRVVIIKVSQTMDLQIISAYDRENQGSQQAALCGVLQVYIQKLSASYYTKNLIHQDVDQIMMLLLKVFDCGSSAGHREAMLCIGALAHATGAEFGSYMQKFYKYMDMGLQNYKDLQVFAASIEVVGDICRALDDKILPFCDGIMSHLFNCLSGGVNQCTVAPLIFSCFGDIGIAIKEHFEKYLPNAMLSIQAASEICAKMDSDNEEMINYNYQLRRGIFEAYSGILQGFRNSKSELMLPHAGRLLQFIEFVYRDKTREESVSRAAVAAMGDLADTLGPNLKILIKDRAFYSDFLKESLDSDDYKMKEITAWTQRMMKRVF